MDATSLRALFALSGGFVRALWRPARYTQQEVRVRLLPGDPLGGPRSVAVQAAAAEVGAWMRLLPRDAAREHRLGLAADRLPSVVFWYRHGRSAEEIGRRLTPLGERCYGDRAINAACALIAELLNSGNLRGGAASD